MKIKTRLLYLIFSTCLLLGCSAQGNSEPDEKVILTDEEMELAYESPDEYKGKYIKFIGRVYSDVKLGEQVCFEVYAEPELHRKNTLVYYTGVEEVKQGEYYELEGKIIGTQEFNNQKLEKTIGLAIETDSIRPSSYIECCSPTQKEIILGETIDQNGYVVTIDKIEFAEKETRLYLTLTNNGAAMFNLSSYRVFIVQNQVQHEQQINVAAKYESLDLNLQPGVQSSGIIAFPALDQESGFMVYCDAYSEEMELEDYVFEY